MPWPATPSAAAATPADVDAGSDELVVYNTTDQDEVNDLIKAFRSRHAAVRVSYTKQNSGTLYTRVLSDVAAHKETADVVWSSAMGDQMKLVNDGYAMSVPLGDGSHIATWSVWKDEAYGITAEPIAIAYNRNAIAPNEVPKSHAALRGFLIGNADALNGRVATYNPETSDSGLLFLATDVEITPSTWDLVGAIGRTNPQLLTTTSSMLEGVSSGRLHLAYNVIGSYALARSQHDSAVGVVLPTDSVILMSRIAFVPTAARHPDLGKAFLEFLLSRDGQAILSRNYFGSVRNDVEQNWEAFGNLTWVQPIHIGPALLAYRDQARRASLFRQWRHAVQSR